MPKGGGMDSIMISVRQQRCDGTAEVLIDEDPQAESASGRYSFR
jgi:hypothetical protein